MGRRPAETIRLGLTPIRRLLARLGNPHQGLPVVHVAGTNGKGSVIAFLEAICLAAGIPVAVFTSPHLIRFNERLRVNRVEIDDLRLNALLHTVLAQDPEEETTFFELTTAAALYYFATLEPFRRQQGVVLLETGLGGRLDATNVVRPWVSVITAVGMDHMDYLGHALAGIAREKAGILKKGVAAVAGPANREAAQVVAGVAARLGVPLALAGRDFGFAAPFSLEMPQRPWRFWDQERRFWLPGPALPGRHQYANAALAVAAARILGKRGYPVSDRALRTGIAMARWPGRLECFPGPPPVWLDGAHNPQGVRALVDFLRSPASGGTQPFTALIFSVLNNKDGASMAALLAPWVQVVFTVCCGGERARTLPELRAIWPRSGPQVVPCQTAQAALDAARLAATSQGRVVVAGSLYLVGEVRSLLC
ncbi:MAG: bifunctional folylpolyglutamate synthase/dihydrofolate synthase [Magnetococcales bacterium]|nr:bifunctional folylpolyglutamate synthase/dihydrofolate synthase [Magnetococcales bacterium]